MRKILFRGKTKDRWVYGSFIDGITGAVPVIFTTPNVDDHFRIEFGYDHVYPETVGQYTGLTDKNGKKIFEGDIISDEEIGLLGTVVYATPQDGFDGFAGFMVNDVIDGLQNYNGFWHLTEVIGNIHDNPELLGAADE